MGSWIQEHSAGGVVVRQTVGGREALLIRPRGRDRWQLPKGGIDAGESSDEAAVREVREEGGVQASVLAPLDPVKFFYQMNGKRFIKTVDFYLMQYVSGSPDDHDNEVDEARWFPLAEARDTLTFESERILLRTIIERDQSGEVS